MGAKACVLIALAAVIYGNTVWFDYALDDHIVVADNRFTLAGLAGVADILGHDSMRGYYGVDTTPVAGGRYRPLSLVTYALEVACFGKRPGVSHFINVLCYAATVVVLFLLVHRLVPEARDTPWFRSLPFLAAAFFAVHPVHTEVVANIKGRDDILSLLLGLWALLCWLRYVEAKTSSWAVATAGLFFLSLMSKESTISFLAAGPLMLWYFTRRRPPEILVATAPLLGGALAYAALRFAVIGNAPATVAPELMNAPFLDAHGGQRLATILFTWLLYLKLLLVPYPLTHDYYPYHVRLVDFSDPLVAIAIAVTGLLLTLMVRGATRRSIVSFCIAWCVATLLLYSNLLFDIGTFMNERFLYLPTVAVSVLVAWMLLAYVDDRRLVAGTSVALMLAGGFWTFTRNFAWKDDVTLALTDVETSRGSARAQMAAGWAHYTLATREPEGAIRQAELTRAVDHLRLSLRICETYYPTFSTMGAALVERGDYEEALRSYETCFRMKPRNPDVADAVEVLAERAAARQDFSAATHAYEMLIAQEPTARRYGRLGELYGKHVGDLTKAEENLRAGLRLEPDNGTLAGNLGIVYAMSGQTDEAITMFDRALTADPRNARIYLNKGRALRQLGKTAEADEMMRRASQLDPSLAP